MQSMQWPVLGGRQGHWEEAREAFRAMLSPAARCKPSLCTINTILAAQLRQGQFSQARLPAACATTESRAQAMYACSAAAPGPVHAGAALTPLCCLKVLADAQHVS